MIFIKIISVASNKGGVGKTTTAVNLASAFKLQGKNVLLVDFDPQANATINLGVNPDEQKNNIFTIMIGDSKFEDTIIKTKYCDLLPSHEDLSELDMILILNKDKINPVAMLCDTLISHKNDYDYIIIDTPPSKGLLTINALVASGDVIIPMQCEYLSTHGVVKVIEMVNKVKNKYNSNLNIMGIVATMYNVRTNISSIVLQEARKHFIKQNIKVFDTTIYRSVKYAESPMLGVPAIIAYAEHEAMKNYISLSKEIESIWAN